MENLKRAWVVRANPHGNRRIDEFLERNLVAIGWPNLGNLARSDLVAIKSLLQKTKGYRKYDNKKRAGDAGQLDTFVNRVIDGNYVLVPDPRNGAVFFGEFRGGYRYAQSKDNDIDGYPHQRKVMWLFDRIPVPRNELPPALYSSLKSHWPIFSVDADAVKKLVGRRQRLSGGPPLGGDWDTDEHAIEGDRIYVLTARAKRDRKLRDNKIRQALRTGSGRLICEVRGCGFDFEAQYGEIGKGFVHIHHRKPLGMRGGRRAAPLRDLAMVCANCHAMIHRHGKCRSLDTLIPKQNAPRSEL
ncbi:MAG TPA: hypothetical protein VG269_16560 [Tepidisphaeraceae bacterium]|jgi:hypothetical protein|nr:hypothetical protein [Tepidisphaeraceae bacterium]